MERGVGVPGRGGQAVAVFQSMADHVGDFDVEQVSKSRGIRQLAASAQRQAPTGASVHIADAIFSLAPHLVVLRTMRNPKHNLPLATIGQSPTNAFSNRDLLLGKAKTFCGGSLVRYPFSAPRRPYQVNNAGGSF